MHASSIFAIGLNLVITPNPFFESRISRMTPIFEEICCTVSILFQINACREDARIVFSAIARILFFTKIGLEASHLSTDGF